MRGTPIPAYSAIQPDDILDDDENQAMVSHMPIMAGLVNVKYNFLCMNV